MAIKRALLSVSDKTGLVELARTLKNEFQIELLSTGGTARTLRDAGIEVQEVSDYTNAPEILDGRVKTLHPKIHGGLLQRRELPAHQNEAQKHNIPPIDLVIVNLYPFEETISKKETTHEEAVENIDIGGPSMLRSAAKNHSSVTVVCEPADYESLIEEMRENRGDTSLRLREALALKVFQHTAQYDLAIANYLGGSDSSTKGSFSITLPLEQELRYGDNPHQSAHLYGSFNDCFTQLQGKDLSYTNVLDIDAAANLITDFKRPTVAILKHTNPCGIGQHDEDLREAWQKAFETDRQAPFGGVIVCNRPIDSGLARIISGIFTDIIIAPDYEAEARAILQKKKNLRLIRLNQAFHTARRQPILRSAAGGLLIMDKDHTVMGLENLEQKVVTERPPTKEELIAMRFAWRVVKHVKSNAIVFTGADRTLGIGAGQMSRVDSVRFAISKSEQAGLDLTKSIVASDAMFPFADGLEAAIKAGASACIQPGGSKNDQQVIDAANQANMAMVFTQHRHFLH